MTYTVLVAVFARNDADEVFDWIAMDSGAAAERWLEGLDLVFASLRTFPNRGKLAPEGRRIRRQVRQLMYGRYRIIYVVVGDEVRVLHVRHGARRPLRKL